MKWCMTRDALEKELSVWVDKINSYLGTEEVYTEDGQNGTYLCFKSLDDLSFLFSWRGGGVYFFNGIISSYATYSQVTLDLEESECIIFEMRDKEEKTVRFLFDLCELRLKIKEK